MYAYILNCTKTRIFQQKNNDKNLTVIPALRKQNKYLGKRFAMS